MQKQAIDKYKLVGYIDEQNCPKIFCMERLSLKERTKLVYLIKLSVQGGCQALYVKLDEKYYDIK